MYTHIHTLTSKFQFMLGGSSATTSPPGTSELGFQMSVRLSLPQLTSMSASLGLCRAWVSLTQRYLVMVTNTHTHIPPGEAQDAAGVLLQGPEGRVSVAEVPDLDDRHSILLARRHQLRRRLGAPLHSHTSRPTAIIHLSLPPPPTSHAQAYLIVADSLKRMIGRDCRRSQTTDSPSTLVLAMMCDTCLGVRACNHQCMHCWLSDGVAFQVLAVTVSN